MLYLRSRLNSNRLVNLRNRFGEEVGYAIFERKPLIGMSHEMLVMIFGIPPHADEKITRENMVKQTFYFVPTTISNKIHYRYKITLVNDKVTEIRES